MNKILSGVKGFFIGAANILPGISAGTLMVVFNVYDRFVDATNLFLKHPFKAIVSILDILIGFILGIIVSFLVVSYTYKSFPLVITLFVLGLVLGGYKDVFDKIKGKQKVGYIIVLIISALIVGVMPLMSYMEGIYEGWLYYIMLFILGLFAAFFLVAPGISGALFLLIVGYYYHILDLGRNIFKLIINGQFIEGLKLLPPIIVLGVSVIIGLVISLKLIKKIMVKYETGFYFSVMGLLIGSPFAIIILLLKDYKITSFGYGQWIVGILLLILSTAGIILMNKYEKGQEKLVEEAVIEEQKIVEEIEH